MWSWTSIAAVVALSVTSAPRDMRVDESNFFYLEPGALVVLADSLVDERDTLLAPLRSAAGGTLRVARASAVNRRPEGVYIGTDADPGGLGKRRFRKYLYGVDEMGEEGYRLEVGKDGIMLAGGGKRGVWHGLHTVADLVEEYGSTLPYLRIRDWPAAGVRGVYLTTRPSAADLERFAALKCTHVFLDSADYYDLSGVRAETWRNVFKTARENYLEPVPVFSTLDGMERFLRERPMLIEGRAVTEEITLNSVRWAELRYPNIIAGAPEDLEVSISGVPCVHGRDYWVEPQPLVAPFLPERPRWRIRRELEGAIPDGAEVTVRYGFATDDSATLCFAAPEARAWLETAFERLIDELGPRHIHLDHGSIARLNTDPRSRALGLSDPAYFIHTLEQLEAIIHGIDPDIGLMMWADLVNPFQGARVYGLSDAAAQIPESIARWGRIDVGTPGEAGARFEQLQPVASEPRVTLIDGAPGALGAFQQMRLEYGEAEGGGLIVPATTPESAATPLDMAWGGLADGTIWTRRLNRYFDVVLRRPDFEVLRGTLVDYLNETTLRGEAPEAVNRRFQDYCGRHLDVLYEDEAGYQQVRTMLALLTEYLALENRFTTSGGEGALRRLRGLVTDWQALEPDAPAERYQRILDTIAEQQLFVPATILFQEDLRYYRDDRPPHPQFPIPVRPAFDDARGETTATIDLMPGQAAVRRIDFESVRLAEVVLAGRAAGGRFETIKRWTGEGLAGVRGPLLVPGGAGHDAIRLRATSNGEQAVLRDLHLYGAKEPAELACAYAVQAPRMEAIFEGRAWPEEPAAGWFLRLEDPSFAEAPTALRACRTRSDLYIGIEASDPRPDTMVADFTQRDAPLWQQESVEIWLHPPGRLPLRLVVSPLGTQYDSEAGDGGWDGDWEAVAAKTDTGWNAVVRVPVELVGALERGRGIPFNVVRNRHSVVQERSAWAHGYGAQPDLQWGVLRFP